MKAENANDGKSSLLVGLCVVAVAAAVWHFARSPCSDIAPAAAPTEAPAGQRVIALMPAAPKEEPSVATVPDRSAVQAPQVKHTQPRQSPGEVVRSRAHVAAQPVPDAMQMVIEEARRRLVIEDTNPSMQGQLQKTGGLANSSGASLAKLRRKKRAEMARTFRRGYGIDVDDATVDALTALFVTESVNQARL